MFYLIPAYLAGASRNVLVSLPLYSRFPMQGRADVSAFDRAGLESNLQTLPTIRLLNI